MIVEYPLSARNRARLARAFAENRRVDVGIDCALEGAMGAAFVDDVEDPTVYCIRQGPFWYVAGDARSDAGRALLGAFPPYSLLMAPPAEWAELAGEIHGEKLVAFPRYSFSPERLSIDHLEGLLGRSRFKDALQRVDAESAAWMQDREAEIFDVSAFGSAQEFLIRGVGYCLVDGERVLGVAYSSLAYSRGIEVSLFVVERHRRRGIATALACALLLECLERGLRPNWDAANRPSCNLAEKLGYVPLGSYKAHYWVEPAGS